MDFAKLLNFINATKLEPTDNIFKYEKLKDNNIEGFCGYQKIGGLRDG